MIDLTRLGAECEVTYLDWMDTRAVRLLCSFGVGMGRRQNPQNSSLAGISKCQREQSKVRFRFGDVFISQPLGPGKRVTDVDVGNVIWWVRLYDPRFLALFPTRDLHDLLQCGAP